MLFNCFRRAQLTLGIFASNLWYFASMAIIAQAESLAINSFYFVSKADFRIFSSKCFVEALCKDSAPAGLVQKRQTSSFGLIWSIVYRVVTMDSWDTFSGDLHRRCTFVWLYFSQQDLCHMVLFVIKVASMPFISSSLFRLRSLGICPSSWNSSRSFANDL